MNKPLVPVLGILVLACLVAWFFLGSADVATPTAPGVTPETTDPVAVDAPGVQKPLAAPAAAARTELERSVADEVGDDPVYRRALAGFRGRLVLPGGEPAPRKPVRFVRLDPEALQNPSVAAVEAMMKLQLEVHETTSAADGRFEVSGVWPRAVYLFVADHRGDNQRAIMVQQMPGPGQVVDLGDIELPALGTIRGRVVDEDGEPVGDAMVRAADIPAMTLNIAPIERFDPEGGLIFSESRLQLAVTMPPYVMRLWNLLPIPTTHSAGDGTFTLRGAQPGPNTLVVNKRGFVPRVTQLATLRPGQVKDAGELRLDRGEIVKGKVLDTADQPVAGVEVLIATRPMALPLGFASFADRTDSEGRFSLSGLGGGALLVAVRRSPRDAWIVHSEPSIPTEALIRLPARQTLTLAVKDGEGRPVDGARFKMVCAPGGRGPGLDLGTLGATPWIDVDRRVQRTEDRRYRIADVDPGSYSVAVLAAGYASALVEVLVDAEAVEQEVVLQPASALRVVVIDAAKRPVRNARVYAVNRGPRGNRVQHLPIYAGRTGADGTVSIEDAAPGAVRVSASHPAYGVYHTEVVAPRAEPVVFEIQEAGWITGVLLDGDKPPQPGLHGIAVHRHWEEQRGAMEPLPRMTVPDLAGAFRVDGLAPGRYRVMRMPGIGELGTPGGVLRLATGAIVNPEAVEAIVKPGEGVHVELDVTGKREITGPTARVFGTVLVNGRPGKGLAMNCWGVNRRFSADVDADGRFDLRDVPIGDVRLMLVASASTGSGVVQLLDGRLWYANRKIEAGKDLQLDLRIDTGSLAGVVVDAAGAPVSGVEVDARGVLAAQEGEGRVSNHLQAATDRAGRFSFPQLPAGTYQLRVHGDAGFGEVEGQVIQAALQLAGVRIQVEQVYTVRGRVDVSVYPERPDNLHVRLRGRVHRGVDVNMRDASFEVTGVPAGDYDIDVFNFGTSTRANRMGRSDGKVRVRGAVEDLTIKPVFTPRERAGSSRK